MAILNKLNLRKQYDAVIRPITNELLSFLPKIRPYIIYGSPSIKTIEQLIKRRGYYQVCWEIILEKQ